MYPTLVNNSTLYIWIPLTYPACHLGNLHSPFYASYAYARAYTRTHTRACLLTRSRFVYLCVEHALGTHIVRIRGTRRPWILPFCLCRCNVGFNGGGRRERERERGGSERGIRRSWGKDQTSTAIIHAPWSLGTVEEWVSRSVVSKNRVILLLMRIMCSSRVSQGKWYMEMYVEIFGSRALRWKWGGDF